MKSVLTWSLCLLLYVTGVQRLGKPAAGWDVCLASLLFWVPALMTSFSWRVWMWDFLFSEECSQNHDWFSLGSYWNGFRGQWERQGMSLSWWQCCVCYMPGAKGVSALNQSRFLGWGKTGFQGRPALGFLLSNSLSMPCCLCKTQAGLVLSGAYAHCVDGRSTGMKCTQDRAGRKERPHETWLESCCWSGTWGEPASLILVLISADWGMWPWVGGLWGVADL